MIDIMLTVTAIVAVGLVVAELLSRRSAALRHAVLAIALGCAAIAPALRPVVPAWHVPPALLQARHRPLALYIPIQARELRDDNGTSPVAIPVTTVALRWVLRVWLAGLALGIAFLAIGFARLAWLAGRSRRVNDGRRFALLQAMSRGFGLRRRVVLLQSDHPSLLVTWGMWPPQIILPRASDDWTSERERVVLAHELAHIARRDWLVHVAAEIVRVVYWFNPLVWIACRRLRRESEHAYDDAVLAMGVAGSDYASHLLDLARTCRAARVPFVPAPAMARPSSLERRVTAMLNTHLNRAPLTSSARAMIAIALLAVTVSVAGVRASADANAQFSGTLLDAVGRILPDTPMTLSGAQGGQTYQCAQQSERAFRVRRSRRRRLRPQRESARIRDDAGARGDR
jgi:beta-lactamase regulating signal transducer with metallopeptidase domain